MSFEIQLIVVGAIFLLVTIALQGWLIVVNTRNKSSKVFCGIIMAVQLGMIAACAVYIKTDYLASQSKALQCELRVKELRKQLEPPEVKNALQLKTEAKQLADELINIINEYFYLSVKNYGKYGPELTAAYRKHWYDTMAVYRPRYLPRLQALAGEFRKNGFTQSDTVKLVSEPKEITGIIDVVDRLFRLGNALP